MVSAHKLQLMRAVVVMLVLFSTNVLAAVQATVDRNPVVMNESFNLILRSDGSDGVPPKLDVLKADFEILGQSSSTNFQMLNGTTSRSMQWNITLMAKRTGTVTIPAIMLGSEASQSIALQVRDTPDTNTQGKGAVFVEVSAEPHEPYVQQQMIVTVRLFYAVQLGRGSSLSDPDFGKMNPLMQHLESDREFQTTRNGREYSVIERRYAVFAPQSGVFEGGTVTFDGSVVDGSQGSTFGFDSVFGSTRRARIRSNSLTLNIKPIPSNMDANRWLPASKIELQEQWSENPPKFVVGEPLTRTLTIRATAALAAQLPVLEGIASEGLKLYPDQPVLKDEQVSGALQSTREQKFAVIPTRSGKFVLPAIEVPWWNIVENKLEVAHLPERQITVLPANGKINANDAANDADGVTSDIVSKDATNTQAVMHTPPTVFKTVWPWLAMVCALGWVLTALWWWRSHASAQDKKQAVATIHVESLRRLRQQIKAACAENDADAVKPLLLSWAAQRWSEDVPHSLTAIARRCDASLAKALLELDVNLYSTAVGKWQGAALWAAFERAIPESRKTEASSALKLLYESK